MQVACHFLQGGLTGKVRDTGYPEVPHPQGLKKVFQPKFFLSYNAVFLIISTIFAPNFAFSSTTYAVDL